MLKAMRPRLTAGVVGSFRGIVCTTLGLAGSARSTSETVSATALRTHARDGLPRLSDSSAIPSGTASDTDAPEHRATRGIDGKELVRAGRGDDERRVVRADLDRERRRQGHALLGMLRRQGLEVDERHGPSGIGGLDARDPIQEGAILQLRQAMFLRARLAIDVVPRVGLGDEDPTPWSRPSGRRAMSRGYRRLRPACRSWCRKRTGRDRGPWDA